MMDTKPSSRSKKRYRWHTALPLHLLILALALSLSDPLKRCGHEVDSLLKKSREDAEEFAHEHPLEVDSLQGFRESRSAWHRDFHVLLHEVEKDYKSIIAEEGYTGSCRGPYPVIIFLLDALALSSLILTAGYFLFQDATTPFGASGQEVFVALNVLLGMFTILGVFTFPAFGLLNSAVQLSEALINCPKELKTVQRKIVASALDLDQYNLHSNVYDGMIFGVREPVFNYHIDRSFEEWLYRWLRYIAVIGVGIAGYLSYRTNVKSLVKWRAAIPSVVCIGVVFPGSADPNKLWRVGSGCIVSSSKGLILTNWHLFQRMGADPDPNAPLGHREWNRYDLHRQDSDAWSVGSRTEQSSPTFGAMQPSPSLFRSNSNNGAMFLNSTSTTTTTTAAAATVTTGTSEDESLFLQTSTISSIVHEARLESMKRSLQSLRSGDFYVNSNLSENPSYSLSNNARGVREKEDDELSEIKREEEIEEVLELVGGGNSLFREDLFAVESSSATTMTFNSTIRKRKSNDGSASPASAVTSDQLTPLVEVPHHAQSAPPAMDSFRAKSTSTDKTNPRQHRHLTNQLRYVEAFADVFPEMKIYIGTVARGHPKWEYEAAFTGVESPSAEFTPFGLDLLLLKITNKVNFTGLQTQDEHGAENLAYTYNFQSVETNPIQDMTTEGLVKFQIGNPFKLSAGVDKLRLLGYPASGGFTLSVLTGYFTSMSFDYATQHRGAWLNTNIALPHGGSGGPAINSKGELVGICTQTKGDLTNIRSISEAKHLIERAKSHLIKKEKKHDLSVSKSNCVADRGRRVLAEVVDISNRGCIIEEIGVTHVIKNLF